MTKEEQEYIDKLSEAKRIKDEEAAENLEAEKIRRAQKNVSDFEKLSKGEKIKDDRNLQQVFADFFKTIEQKRNEIDIKDLKNSAKTSIGSLSSKLEERRKKIMDLKGKVNMDNDLNKNEANKTDAKE